MKKIFTTTVGLAALAIFVSSAQAINLSSASVVNGLAAVSGGKAAVNANISWEGSVVTKANKNGGFSFSFGVVPTDCVGSLSDGVSTIDVTLLNCTPVTPPPSAKVLKTGQTTSYAARDDGAIQAGATVPNPRFTDNGNGTVTDNLTKLIWLKNASCLNVRSWANALATANALADGNVLCGLADGSVAGDWRLPNIRELESLVDLGTNGPALPALHPFINFFASFYWSSTTAFLPGGSSSDAWLVDFNGGGILNFDKTIDFFVYVTAVRGGL